MLVFTSLTNTKSPIFNFRGFTSTFGSFSLAFFKFSAVTKYKRFSASICNLPPCSPQNLGAGSSRLANGVMGSLPNINTNGDSLELWQGKKLYAADAIGTNSSHSNAVPRICFATQALKNLW